MNALALVYFVVHLVVTANLIVATMMKLSSHKVQFINSFVHVGEGTVKLQVSRPCSSHTVFPCDFEILRSDVLDGCD